METLTRRVDQVSRLKVRVATIIPVPQSMALRKKLTKLFEHWPLALLIFGSMLTVAWLCLLIWIPFRLLLAV
jgi:hypothetical protein